ncbi:Uncharacterized protein HA466_0147140 [Hirschfeldia incana]|nr:Uncharacterized protein HA466_0147140 [Hirschfeldia incana]
MLPVNHIPFPNYSVHIVPRSVAHKSSTLELAPTLSACFCPSFLGEIKRSSFHQQAVSQISNIIDKRLHRKKMQDPRNHVPSSPTISSVSSSDLDTESTGSFFHDRSITLGTLMGLSFTATMMPFRASSHRHVSPSLATSDVTTSRKQRKRPPSNSAERQRRRKWWRFCRDDDDEESSRKVMQRGAGDCSRRSSLGEYLEVERRFGDEAVYGSAEVELEGAVARYREQQPAVAERALFADGRVLPPADIVTGESTPEATALCRFPVSLTGICSGGG